MIDLTICSVSFHSGLHLAANYDLTREINGDVRWIVAQNGPAEDLPRFTVIPGASAPATIGPGNQNIKAASYHHAVGLNATLPYITTRFALFLDPDFFVVPPLARILDEMTSRELAFFGAPYAIDPNKPRRQDFPCAFCMFVDTEKVDVASFDFMPDVSRLDVMADTGFQIYTRYSGSPHDAVLPSYSAGPTSHRHTTRQLSDICQHQFAKASTDAYFWDEKLFGIHLHMKLHINLMTIGKFATKLAAKADLQTVRQIVTTSRSQWGLSNIPPSTRSASDAA
jgi:hypothetical protein